jgi:hypothetical protein
MRTPITAAFRPFAAILAIAGKARRDRGDQGDLYYAQLQLRDVIPKPFGCHLFGRSASPQFFGLARPKDQFGQESVCLGLPLTELAAQISHFLGQPFHRLAKFRSQRFLLALFRSHGLGLKL